jgi:hypothetical protein
MTLWIHMKYYADLDIILTVYISRYIKQTFYTEQNKCRIKLLNMHSLVGPVHGNNFCCKTVLWSL